MTLSYESMFQKAEAITNEIIQWRRHLHANPELSFYEFKTAQFVMETLRKIPNMEVTQGVGSPTAIVAQLSSMEEGPTIAIRADMDALPIHEETTHAFKSNNEGVMHACGHDAHTAILLGVAHLMAESFEKGEMKGTVKFLFQPAEESMDEAGFTGSPYMIKAGVLDDVDCILALHVSPENQVGVVQVNNGYSMANVDVFEATIYGTGGHGAYPHLGTDPIFMLGPVLQALNGIVSRKISPLDPAVVSIGQIQAGSASNIIPNEVFIQGTFRSYDPKVRKQLEDELGKVFSLVTALGGEYTFAVQHGEPALYNDPTINGWIRETIQQLFPNFEIKNEPFGLGGEDFAHMTKVVPGAMFFLGGAFPDGVQRELHTSIFDIDERSLPIGVSILAETATRYLLGKVTL